MLWSLIKIVVFIVLIAAMTVGAGYLMNTSGGIRVSVANTEFNLGPLQAVMAMILLVLLVWLFLKLVSFLVAMLRFLNGDETAISRYFDRNRERKGFQALADGLMALASGEGREAMSKASRAERFLQRPELTNLITAQAAEMTGDRKKAEEVYKQLLQDARTRFVGVRGILKQRLDEGDTDTALKLAEKAFALKPRHEETQDILLQLQAQNEDWTGARRTLGAKLKHGSLPRDVYRRRDAVLALSEARDVFTEGNTIEAREEAIEANRLSPDLIPAAVMAAQGYVEQGKPRYATRILVKAWEARPHPDLAAAFAAIEPDETPTERLKRFLTLTRHHPEDPETRMLLAELNIAAEDFPAARKALGDLATAQPTARALTIMAAIERGAGADDSVVRGWLTRALGASRGPQWVCNNCHSVRGAWAPVCPTCHAFDTLSWTEPSEDDDVKMAGAAEMLPLIVGKELPAVAPVAEATLPKPEPSPGTSPELSPDASPETPDDDAITMPKDTGKPATGPGDLAHEAVADAEVIDATVDEKTEK